jgi:hypothetical protein
MVGKTFTRVLCVVFALTLACGSLLAQSRPRTAHTNNPSRVFTPDTPLSPQLQLIYSNLGTGTSVYNDTTGYYVTGTTSDILGTDQWIGLPFTPKSASHATAVEAAIGYEDGTERVILAIYSDNAGTPGTLLASGASSTIPTFGTCCQLVKVKIASTALTAGTQYWLVAMADDTNAPDLTSVWQSTNQNIAGDVSQAGWFTFGANVPAGAVAGTIP